MAAANLAEAPAWATDLLEGSPVGHLSYLDDRDRPRVLPVTFARAGADLWTAIDQKPKGRPANAIARVRYLRRRPQAALCADHYEEDWSRLAWVQVVAAVEILEGDARDDRLAFALKRLQLKYQQYAADPPEGPFARLRPQRVLWWRAAADDSGL